MLYLIDSSAKHFFGHNLEYLKRISLCAKSQSIILGNRDLDSRGDSRCRPTFEFGTWDFGRFGLQRKKFNGKEYRHSKTLRSSKSTLVAEEIIEKTASVVAKCIGRQILLLVAFSKQSRCYFRDITEGLAESGHSSTLLVSTANARELLGLRRWLGFAGSTKSKVTVILRRPIVDLHAIPEIPLIFFDAVIQIALLRDLARNVNFVADTPALAASITRRTGVTVTEVPAMGFEVVLKNLTSQFDVAVAPNSRQETRYSFNSSTIVPDLGQIKGANLDSSSYRQLLLTTRSLVLPYDPLRYRLRSSGIFAEALTLGILPIVPTGTSMSREITKLNSTILPKSEYCYNLKVGDRLDLSQFGEENFLMTLEPEVAGSYVLEFSDSASNTMKSTCDFFISDSKDSFFFQSTDQVFFSFSTRKKLLKDERALRISVHKIPSRLFGACYFENGLERALIITKDMEFSGSDNSLIRTHSPASICKSLGI
jgi:hypothetical protein